MTSSLPHLPRILLVEDNRHVRRLTEQVLVAEGYAVEVAVDGAAALASISANQPDLVLSDGRMPGLDGWTLCAYLRTRAATAHLRFVLCSADPADFSGWTWQEAGADAFIEKPFRSAELVRLIGRILQPVETLRTPSDEVDSPRVAGAV